MALTVPLLIGLCYQAGSEKTFSWTEDTRDALVALAIGFAISALVLAVFGVIGPDTRVREMVDIVSLQAIPASIGAVLARSQLGGQAAERSGRRPSTRYLGELFVMAVGALFLALNVAPTEEMVLVAYKMHYGQALALALGSILLMHAFVYAVECRGQAEVGPHEIVLGAFARYTLVGYALALLISAFIL